MASLDIFHSDPFTTIQLTSAIERVPYLPQGIESLALFDDKPIRTKVAMVEQRQGQLVILNFLDRGAPRTQRTMERRQARGFNVPRIGMQDTIYAEEIATIREFGSETELMQVQTEVGRRLVGPTGLRSNVRYTQEYHKLAAIQGLLLDSDGSVLHNWFQEFGIAQPQEIPFNFANLQAQYVTNGIAGLRSLCNQVVRNMKRAAQGSWIEGRSRAVALCGDAFFDALISTPEVRSTYLNWMQAQELRQNLAFEVFNWGGIDWVNYRGSDDVVGLVGTATANSGTIACSGIQSAYTVLGKEVSVQGMQVSGPGIPAGATIGSVSVGVSFTLASSVVASQSTNGIYNVSAGGNQYTGGGSISIPSNKVKFAPRFAPGIFEKVMAPADSFDWINTLGKPEYVRIIPDTKRNEHVGLEMDSFALHICTRPETLQSGTMDSTAD
jgi:hypothetical protein